MDLNYLIEIIADLVKGYYIKDVGYNLKKYMNVKAFIFNYEYNVIKCKKDFSGYALIILMTYIVGSLLLLYKILIPILEGDEYFKIILIALFVLLILIMLIINGKLFRYFLGDVGDLKNVDMTKKEAIKKYKDILLILAYYVVAYILILISIITSRMLFLIISILMFFSLVPVNEIYERKLRKIQRSVREYYKDSIKIKTSKEVKKYNVRETVIQILSNNDLVVIESKNRYPNLIRADEIKYIRIEDDLYYIKNGIYQIKENYFKDKTNSKYRKNKSNQARKGFIRRRKQLNVVRQKQIYTIVEQHHEHEAGT